MISIDVDSIREIEDPTERARATREVLAVLARETLALSHMLTDAVRDLRKTMTARQIAALLGISSARVIQIEHRGPAWKRARSETS